MNKNFITWILLVLLSIMSYFSTESTLSHFSVIALMIIAVIKCALVGFQFMELNRAHIIWRIAFLSLIGMFSLFISINTIVE